jgi:hypothetical protein
MAGTSPAMTSYVLSREASMTAYLISLALAGLVAIAVWEVSRERVEHRGGQRQGFANPQARMAHCCTIRTLRNIEPRFATLIWRHAPGAKIAH